MQSESSVSSYFYCSNGVSTVRTLLCKRNVCPYTSCMFFRIVSRCCTQSCSSLVNGKSLYQFLPAARTDFVHSPYLKTDKCGSQQHQISKRTNLNVRDVLLKSDAKIKLSFLASILYLTVTKLYIIKECENLEGT